MRDAYQTIYDKPNIPCEPERTSEVYQALNHLNDCLYAIQELKNVLRGRLQPILKSYKKDCDVTDKCVERDAGIPLVNSLDAYVSISNGIINDLEDIIERLGI